MKLHRLSVLYRAGKAAVNVAGAAFFLAIGLPAVLDGAVAVLVFGSVVILGLAAILGWQVAYYRRFEYELTPDTFDVASGVLSRRSREIPYQRVQNVSIDRTVVQRVLGLAEVRLETAGGSGTEAHLQYVSVEEAERLQDEIGERKRREAAESGASGVDDEDVQAGDIDASGEATPSAAAGAGAASAAAGADRELLFELSSRELGVLGLVSLDARYVPVVLFGLSTLSGSVDFGGLGRTAIVLGIAAIVLVILAISAVVSGAYAITSYYGFRLVRVDDELRYERGLLQRSSGTIPLAKVQALTISENPLARLAGYAKLVVETAGFSPGESGGSQAAVPIAKRDRVTALATEIEPVELGAFERPPTRARTRYVVRYAALVAIAAAAAFLAARAGYWIGPWWLPLLTLPLVPVAAHLKYRNIGFALTEDHVLTRYGFWRRRTKIVPYHRVQTVADSQTIFQRRRGLATLHVDIAGSQSLVSDDSKAVDIDRERADELRETIAERLLEAIGERDTRPARPLIQPGTDALDTVGAHGQEQPSGAGGAD